MVRGSLRDGDQIAVVVGKAGTGKTYALDAAREAWQADGHQVIGAALARRAALELRDGAGIDSTSIHALLADLREQPGDLLGAPNRARRRRGRDGRHPAARRARRPRPDGRREARARRRPRAAARDRRRRHLPLAHDPRQPDPARGEPSPAPSSGSSDALELLARRPAPARRSTTYHEHGRLVVADTADDQRERMVEDWWQAARARPRRDHDRAPPRRRRRAQRTAPAPAWPRTRAASEHQALTVHGQPIAVGDQIVRLRNHTGLGVTNGTQGTVTAIDLDTRRADPRDAPATRSRSPASTSSGTTQRGAARRSTTPTRSPATRPRASRPTARSCSAVPRSTASGDTSR